MEDWIVVIGFSVVCIYIGYLNITMSRLKERIDRIVFHNQLCEHSPSIRGRKEEE